MRILYVLEYFPPHIGGVETYFDNLTRGVAKRHDVVILTTLVPSSKVRDVSEGRRVYRVKSLSRYLFTTKFRDAAGLMRSADLVHTSTFVAAGTTWLAKTLVKRPTVLTFHEAWGRRFFDFQPFYKALVNSSLERLICRVYKNSTIITPSTFTRNTLIGRGVPGKNVHVIYHGIDHTVFNTRVKPLRRYDHPTYLFFGRVGVSKGLEYLLDAAPLVARELPEAKLLLMVSTEEKGYRRVERKIDELSAKGIAMQIEPRPSSQEVAAVIRSADVVCVPSLSEGFGFGAVEAQACGVPVVATRAGSLPEVVRGGLLVEPRSPKALAGALTRLLRDEGLCRELGARGASFAKRFTWKSSVRAHLRLYREVVSGNS